MMSRAPQPLFPPTHRTSDRNSGQAKWLDRNTLVLEVRRYRPASSVSGGSPTHLQGMLKLRPREATCTKPLSLLLPSGAVPSTTPRKRYQAVAAPFPKKGR